MNEILNQKFGVEVEMYDITRAQAAVVVKKTLEAWTSAESIGLAAGALRGSGKSRATLPSRPAAQLSAPSWSPRC